MSGTSPNGQTTISGTIYADETITNAIVETYDTIYVEGEIINVTLPGVTYGYIESGGVGLDITLAAQVFEDDLYVERGAIVTDTVAEGATGDLAVLDNDGGTDIDSIIGTNALEQNFGLSNNPTIAGGEFGICGEFDNYGSVNNPLVEGTLFNGSDGIVNNATIASNAFLAYDATSAMVSGDTKFIGTDGTFEVFANVNLGGTTLVGLAGNEILLETSDVNGSVTLNSAAHSILAIANGDTFDFNLDPSVNYTTFTVAEIAQGTRTEIILTDNAPCFVEGTRIMTLDGEIAVEKLFVGQTVITNNVDNTDAPIKWIGKRSIDLRRHPNPAKVQPICFTENCLAEGVPYHDMLLSPDHALYIAGNLIPAKALVDGVNIVQLNRSSVTYYHVELPEHAVIFAEGTPVESYLDTGNRVAFENDGPNIILHPDFAQKMREAKSCAPFVETGVALENARKGVAEQRFRMAPSSRVRRSILIG